MVITKSTSRLRQFELRQRNSIGGAIWTPARTARLQSPSADVTAFVASCGLLNLRPSRKC
jgi:hypothetical protein